MMPVVSKTMRPRSARATWQTNRAGAAVRAALAQQLVDLAELHGVVGAVPARGVDAGGLVERIDLQPRVVGDAREPGGLGVVQRLQPSILGKRRAGFLGLDEIRELLQRDELDRTPARRPNAGVDENPVDLADLAGIGRGDDQLLHARVAVAGSMVPTIVR